MVVSNDRILVNLSQVSEKTEVKKRLQSILYFGCSKSEDIHKSYETLLCYDKAIEISRKEDLNV